MRIKIINEKLSDFGHEYKIKNMNFDMVVVEGNEDGIALSMDDVKLISENKYDEVILRCKDILKIKLNSAISPVLYPALIEYIENITGNRLFGIEVLKDEYKISKRGIWEKKLVVVINHQIPLDITVVAEKYSKEFNISFRDISIQSFLEGCSQEMAILRKDIIEKEKAIERYRNSLKNVLENRVNSKDNEPKKLA